MGNYGYGHVYKNTWDKYLTKIVEKIKVKWLKKDKDKLLVNKINEYLLTLNKLSKTY